MPRTKSLKKCIFELVTGNSGNETVIGKRKHYICQSIDNTVLYLFKYIYHYQYYHSYHTYIYYNIDHLILRYKGILIYIVMVCMLKKR